MDAHPCSIMILSRNTFMASKILPTTLEIIPGNTWNANRDSSAQLSKRRPGFMLVLIA